MKAVTDLLAEYEKVSASFTDGMDPDAMEKALNRQSELQEKIEAVNGWELDHQLEIAMDALRCPPGDSPVGKLSGGERRRDRALPAAPAVSGPAAPGRTHEPSGRRIGRVAGKLSQELQRHGRRHHARPLLPRQYRRVDPRTGLRRGRALEGQLLFVAGPETGTPAARGKGREPAAEDPGARTGMGAHVPARPPGQKQSARRAVSRFVGAGPGQAHGGTGNLYPPRAEAWGPCDRSQRHRQGLRRKPALRGPDLQGSASGHHRHHRPERGRKDDAIPHDHGAGKAGQGNAARRGHR